MHTRQPPLNSRFPYCGKLFSTPWKKSAPTPSPAQKFSILWKTFFHTVEKFRPQPLARPKVFHTVENFFPHHGKILLNPLTPRRAP
mgnify:FL=1